MTPTRFANHPMRPAPIVQSTARKPKKEKETAGAATPRSAQVKNDHEN